MVAIITKYNLLSLLSTLYQGIQLSSDNLSDLLEIYTFVDYARTAFQISFFQAISCSILVGS